MLQKFIGSTAPVNAKILPKNVTQVDSQEKTLVEMSDFYLLKYNYVLDRKITLNFHCLFSLPKFNSNLFLTPTH